MKIIDKFKNLEGKRKTQIVGGVIYLGIFALYSFFHMEIDDYIIEDARKIIFGDIEEDLDSDQD